MLLHPAMHRDRRAAPHAPPFARPLRVLVVDWREPHMAVAHAALHAAGHATLGAAGLDAALALIDDTDVLVLDPGDDEWLVPRLAQALSPDAALVLYGNRFEWLGRAGRSITVVPEGALATLLDVVARSSVRPAARAGTAAA
jgi:hypothetical protein